MDREKWHQSRPEGIPRVMIISTGGTIATRRGNLWVEGKGLLQEVPQLSDHAIIEIHEFSTITSSRMTPDLWLLLARKINELFLSDHDLKGIVVTHGTDTMEETAYFLHLTVKDSRPVVLTGAMKTSDEISADGPANLINAVRVAIHDDAIGRGVLLVMNECILSARDAWKTDNRRPETFQSAGFGFLGITDPDRVQFYRKTGQLHTVSTPFDIMGLDKLPRVDLISDFTGFDKEILHNYISLQPDGLVFQSFAGGRLSKGAAEGLAEVAATVPVVIASKAPFGRIIGDPNPGLSVVYARDLPANKARILLILALSRLPFAAGWQDIFDQFY